ncbi:MAG: DUF934 domain-containing protein [Gammaproteobacteria bacterium]|nr:DUF934 domain-containing protein [Gammaproteobacteria bacterium]
MPALVKNQEIVADDWLLVDTISDYVPDNAIVPFEHIHSTQATAAWIEGDCEIEEAGEQLARLDLVAVNFPAFADGRGLSAATLLRNRFEFKGELRAIGEIQPDLTPFMRRCGFDAFVLADERAAATAIQCMSSMSDFYQGSVIQPQPPYLRNRST